MSEDINKLKEIMVPLVKKYGGFIGGSLKDPDNSSGMVGFGVFSGTESDKIKSLVVCVRFLKITPTEAISILKFVAENDVYNTEISAEESLDGAKISPYVNINKNI